MSAFSARAETQAPATPDAPVLLSAPAAPSDITITASPNPCVASRGQKCTTIVSFQSTIPVQLRVKENFHPSVEPLVVVGTKQDVTIPWIVSGAAYEFSLYDASKCTQKQCDGPALASVSVTARPQFHAVYYHLTDSTWWLNLADDVTSTHNGPTPRELAIASLNDNFKAIRQLGFDTVDLQIPNVDLWHSGHGGGFSYDPFGRPRPDFAVAEEIALRIAAANNLNVIFTIGLSNYQTSSDGRPEWSGMADEHGAPVESKAVGKTGPKGAYDYILSLFNPNFYYGVQHTTKLETIGLDNGATHALFGDPRIIGWQFSAEWAPIANRQSHIDVKQRMFRKYWNYFYSLVHFRGANNAFAGTYIIGGTPAGAKRLVPEIKQVKQWFAPNSGVIQPDLIGLEFYAGSPVDNPDYDLGSFYGDFNALVDAMAKDDPSVPNDFAIPAAKIYMGEGSTNRNPDQAQAAKLNLYFQQALQVLSDRGLAGIQFFVSDTLVTTGSVYNGTLGLTAGMPWWDLFTTKYAFAGYRRVPNGLEATNRLPAICYHGGFADGDNQSYADPTLFTAEENLFAAQYGTWSYTGLTTIGRWVQEALQTHTPLNNLLFYAYPNAAAPGSTSTLFWDVSHMPAVRTVEVHIGDEHGTLIKNIQGGTPGTLSVPVPQTGSEDYVLVDTTNGAGTVLGTVTLVTAPAGY